MTSRHDHDRGLSFDLATMTGRRSMDRRRALQVVAGAGLAALVGCGSGEDGESAAASTTSTAGNSSTTAGSRSAAGSDAECAAIRIGHRVERAIRFVDRECMRDEIADLDTPFGKQA